MGVLGLWRLLDATGKPVPLETLEGKVLAIDISIWIHQVIQGYQDRRGNALPNAHLIGLFNRICKLMYFKIKPVFVFDGGVPLLKKNTIATRRKLKSIAASKAQKLKNDLINNLIKRTAVKGALEKGNDDGESSAAQQFKDATAIPGSSKFKTCTNCLKCQALVGDSDDYMDSDDEIQTELSPRKQTKWMGNIHSVDVNTEEFKNLPADVRYDILTDLKETRKQNSWGRIHELPAGSNNYSGFQVKRLLKRRYVQESLEVAEKEMGGKTLTLEELDRLLTDQGIETMQKQDAAFRIASDSTTRVVYVKDKPALQNNEESNDSSKSSTSKPKEQEDNTNDVHVDSMSIHSDGSLAIVNDIGAYDLDEDWNSDEDFTETSINDSHLLAKNDIPKSVMNPALSYMLENSGFTREEILKIVEQSKKNKNKSDTNSSHSSTKRGKRTTSRLSLRNKSKKKNLFGSIIAESPKIRKEIINEPETIKIEESNSESDDFVEVPESSTNVSKDNIKKDDDTERTIIEQSSSESESDDFIEIKDVPIPKSLGNKNVNNAFQITIKADEELQDDIFADIFVNVNPVKENNVKIENVSIIDETVDNPSHNSSPEKSIKKQESIQVEVKMNKSIEEHDENGSFSMQFSSDNLQLDSGIMSLPTTPQKICLAVEEKTSPHSENFAHEENCIENKTETEVQKTSIETVNDKSPVKSQNISKIDDVTLFSDDFQEISDKEEAGVEKPPTLVLPIDEKELESMKNQLESEQQKITSSLGKLERQAIDITDQMRLEAQELLRLFGVPYIVAPMEAEAQCAYLEQIKLTDGTITDDSDIWLFGGHCVYKNFFDNNKRVLQFLSQDIEHHFKLSRREMIQLALLVGSDYTNGLAGVGPVTALEILAAFPTEGEDILRGLRNFCSWFRAGKLTAPGKTTLRNKLKNVQMEKGFPSQAVVQAYLSPTIDESKEPFSWSKPNLVLLADYAKQKFGWTKLKFEEIINPVMKRLMESKSQMGIASYFKVHSVPKSIEAALSKRVQTAVQKLGGKIDDAEVSDGEASSTSTQGKAKRVKKTTGKKGKKSSDESSELPTIAEAANDESKSKATEDTAEQTKDTISIKVKPRKFVVVDEEVIPQRERDKANALKSKLRAIEIFRKSKAGLNRVQKKKKVVKKIKEDAELSESSSSS
ncbi:mutagen-sensitive 201 [Nasonia vitripennis]|uniref:DNA repair protein complementing XP-G cells homolog n=1 Tax=Nasonia vitripennis TaxID=7425 RepID=A0A7M6UVQ4_NASVI|nr:mutagen-sensitive 201 [Nasonia vitripennis]